MKATRMIAGYIGILIAALLFVTHADGADKAFSANLQSYSSAPAGAYINLVLVNAGADAQGRSNICVKPSGVVAVKQQILPTKSDGTVTATITPRGDISCGGVTGTTQYRVEIRQKAGSIADPSKDPLIAANLYAIDADFVLDPTAQPVSPAPTTSSIDFTTYLQTRPFRLLALANFPTSCTAGKDRIQRSDPDAAGQVDYVCNAAGNGWDLVGDGGGGGGSTPDATTLVKGKVKLAGDLAGTADLPTVPGLAAKEATANKGTANGYAPLDGTSKVPIANLPTGTSGSTVAIGNDSRITGAEQAANKNQANGYAPLDGTSKVPIANLPTGTSGSTVAIGNDSRITGAEQSANKNQANGYAGLNVSSKLAASQLPAPTAAALGGVKGDGSSLTCGSGLVQNGYNADGSISCVTDQTGAPGGGITSLNGSTQASQSFVNGTNIAVSTNTGTGAHTVGITGTIAPANGGLGSSTVPGAGKVPIGDGLGNYVPGDPLVQGLTAHDAPGSSTNPVAIGGFASAAAPTNVSADGDIVNGWFLRNGAQAMVLTAGGALIPGDATNGLKVQVATMPTTTVVGGFADNAAFTPGTTGVSPMAAEVDDTGTTNASENSAGAVRMTPARSLHVTLRDGSGVSQQGQRTSANSIPVVISSDQSAVSVSASSLPLPTGAATAAKQPALGTAGSASTDVVTIQGIASMTAVKVDGSAVTQPVSAASLPLPSGASTSAKQPALGTAGSASSDVITIQGIASMTAVKVDGSAVTQPVSAASLPLPSGAATAANQTATQPRNIAQVGGNSVTTTDNGTQATAPVGTASSTAAVSECIVASAASTNATSCKGSAGNLYGYEIYNSTTSAYYLRLYNTSTAPTCSSATGFIRAIPIPPAGSAGQVNGAISNQQFPTNYGTGIGFCITGGSSSTDNTSAATGLFVTLRYK
jgi:hypothetical protein